MLMKGCKNIVIGGAAAMSYLLRAFTSDTGAGDQNYSDSQVLDTAAEGVLDGSLTILNKQAGSTLAMASNEVRLYNSDNGYHLDNLISQAITRSLGKAALIFVKPVTISSGDTKYVYALALGTTNTPSSNAATYNSTIEAGIMLVITESLYGVRVGSVIPRVGVAITNTYTKLAIVLGGYDANGIPYKDGDTKANFTYGASYFINNILVYKQSILNTATLYAIQSGLYNTASVDRYVKNLLLPDYDFSAVTLATYQTSTPDESAHQAHANLFLEHKLTFPASGAHQYNIKFRYSNATNYWLVKLLSGTAGTDCTLHKVVDNVESAALASADVDFAAATAYTLKLIANGANYYKFYVNDVEKLSYTSTDTHNQSEDDIQVVDVDSSYTKGFIAAWPLTSTTYDSTFSLAGYDY